MSSGQLCALKVIKIKAGEKRERGGEREGGEGDCFLLMQSCNRLWYF